MAAHIFTAERQLIFYVNLDGRRVLVRFGERSMWGSSNYVTTDAKLAAAIREHSMFKRGIITENTQPEEKKVKKPAQKTAKVEKGQQENPADTSQPLVDDGSVENEAEGGDSGEDTGEADVIEVDNFTQAREEVMKRLGIDKDLVKTPPLLSKVAKEHGISIRYRKK